MNLTDAYKVYIDDTLLPITPASITISNSNQNEVIQLANGEYYTLAKYDSAQTFSFDFEIPIKKNQVTFQNASINVKAMTDQLWKIKNEKEPIKLTIIRTHNQPSTNVNVLLDDYSYVEEAENANGYTFSVSFTEYNPQINQEKQSFFVSQSIRA